VTKEILGDASSVAYQADCAAALEEDGAAVLPFGLEPSMVSRLSDAVEKLESGEGVRRRGDVYAVSAT